MSHTQNNNQDQSYSESFSEFSKDEYVPPKKPELKPKSTNQKLTKTLSGEQKRKNFGEMRKLTQKIALIRKQS